MLSLIQKDKILGKHVYFNMIFTQNLEFPYAETSAASADYFMSDLAINFYHTGKKCVIIHYLWIQL